MPLDQVDTESKESLDQQIERILRSDTLRNAEGLRRLLRFLADRTAAGTADQLKEYSVGVDALAKPADYDPRRDAAVRIQVSRLRQKLAEYYVTEGQNDAYLVELPKGHFKVKFTPRQSPMAAAPPPAEPPPPPRWNHLHTALAAIAAAALVWAAVATVKLTNVQPLAAAVEELPASVKTIWGPFLNADRPVLVAIEDPPFVQFGGHGVYREIGLNTWADIEKSETVAKIRRALGNASIAPSHYFAPVGEGSSAFLLGRFLGKHAPTVSLIGVNELSWQQLASHNVLYVGASVFVRSRFADLPITVDMDHLSTGVTNARPGPGELSFYPEDPKEDLNADTQRYALITHIPGPSSASSITVFSSMRTTARLGAVQWLMDPAHAAELIDKMKDANGHLPRYYQVLLSVKFKENVPLETTYVLHHELQAKPK